MNTTSNINNENLSAVVSFVETYGNTSKFLNRPTEFPASIYTLCSYILDNNKETTNWKAVADMFKCFATEQNNEFDKVFVAAGSSVTFFEQLKDYRTKNTYDSVYNLLRDRVAALKAECAKALMEKFEETEKANASNKELEEKVADLNCYCDGCIEEVFEASDADDVTKVFGIVFTDKTEVVKTFYDMASHSIVIEDLDGEELYTTLEDFTEDFIKFCTEKFGEDYTQYWAA